MLEFALDCTRIDIRRNDNPWLNRAALSLAEVIRLAASKALDMEFTELVTGYRLRENAKGFFVDIYLYDSLSGGAGYADSIAGEIEWLLEEVEVLLQSCDCGSSCYKCLKQKKILVYPTMWVEPFEKDVIYVSDFCVKYARPYAVQKIIENC